MAILWKVAPVAPPKKKVKDQNRFCYSLCIGRIYINHIRKWHGSMVSMSASLLKDRFQILEEDLFQLPS